MRSRPKGTDIAARRLGGGVWRGVEEREFVPWHAIGAWQRSNDF